MHLVIGAVGYAGRQVVAGLGDHVRVRTAELGDDLARSMRGADVVHLAFELRSPFEHDHRPARAPDPRLISLVRQAQEAGVRRLVCLSSAQALGFSGEGRVSERTVPQLEHPYERALAADEAWLRSQSRPDVVVLRPAQGFGPGEPLLARLVERMLTGDVPLPGGGGAPRSFLAGSDLGRAFLAAAVRGQAGEAYLLAGVRGSWRDLVQAAARALDVDVRLRRAWYDLAYLGASLLLPRSEAGRRCWPTPFLVDVLSRPHVVDDGWSRRELSWEPEVTTFSAGLDDLADWHRGAAHATPGDAQARGEAYRSVT